MDGAGEADGKRRVGGRQATAGQERVGDRAQVTETGFGIAPFNQGNGFIIVGGILAGGTVVNDVFAQPRHPAVERFRSLCLQA